MIGLRVKALKDDARVLGLIMVKDAEWDIDILPEQVPMIRAAVDAGEISLLKGAEAIPAAVVEAPVVEAPVKAKGK